MGLTNFARNTINVWYWNTPKGDPMIEGFHGVRAYICELTGRTYSTETVRRWDWLRPALEFFNGRVAGYPDKIAAIVRARLLTPLPTSLCHV